MKNSAKRLNTAKYKCQTVPFNPSSSYTLSSATTTTTTVNNNSKPVKAASTRSWNRIKQQLHKNQSQAIARISQLNKQQQRRQLQQQLENIDIYVLQTLWSLDQRVCRDLCMRRFCSIQQQSSNSISQQQANNIEENQGSTIKGKVYVNGSRILTDVKMIRSKFIR